MGTRTTRIRRTNAEFEGCAVLHFSDADYADNADLFFSIRIRCSKHSAAFKIRVIRVIRV